jgi:hypothetical protein
MSNDYCTEHGLAFDWDEHPEGCPECYLSDEHWHDTTTVELLTYERAGSKGFMGDRSLWGVAQWIDSPATAIPHWHVWRYHTDMLVAMQDAMQGAKNGFRWAVICPAPSKGWKSEQHLNDAIGEHYLTGE